MKFFFGTTAACLLLAVLAPAAEAGSVPLTDPQEVGMSAEKLDLLRQHLARLVDEDQTGGIQVLVARRGKVVMHESFGMAGTFGGERLLSRLTVEMMTTNRLPESVPRRRTGPGVGFGLDFGVVTDATLHTVPVSNGEYFWSGVATTTFWVDPEEELIGILFSQYVPFDAPRYRVLMHRMVRAAIVD